MNPFPDFAPNDERNEPSSRRNRIRLLILGAIVGLSPVAILGFAIWRAL